MKQSIDLMSDENIQAIIDDVIKNPPPPEKLLPMNIEKDGSIAIPELMDFINKGYFVEYAKYAEDHAKDMDWKNLHSYSVRYTRWNYFIDRSKEFVKSTLAKIRKRLF